MYMRSTLSNKTSITDRSKRYRPVHVCCARLSFSHAPLPSHCQPPSPPSPSAGCLLRPPQAQLIAFSLQWQFVDVRHRAAIGCCPWRPWTSRSGVHGSSICLRHRPPVIYVARSIRACPGQTDLPQRRRATKGGARAHTQRCRASGFCAQPDVFADQRIAGATKRERIESEGKTGTGRTRNPRTSAGRRQGLSYRSVGHALTSATAKNTD